MPEEQEQEIGNLLEKIIKENFSNLAKEIHIQVQEAQRFPNKIRAKRPTPRHIIIKMPKVKDKETLKSNKRKAISYLQGSSHKTVSWLLKRNCRLEGVGKKYSKSWKAGTYNQDCSTQKNYHLESRQIKSFPDKEKLKEFIITRLLLYEMLKELT